MAAFAQPTLSDEGFKNSLIASGLLHFLGLLLLIFGLPHLMPPLPQHHDPVPFEIVQIADLTNTRVAPPEPAKPAEPPPPKPQPQQAEPRQAEAMPQPKPPTPEAESLKPKPLPKPKPAETKPQQDAFAKLLRNLENQKIKTPKADQTKANSTSTATPQSRAPSLSDRLTISEDDALRRQIAQCWNVPIGARDAQNLVVQVSIDVNPDRTVQHAEIVDKGRMATDSFFRAAAESALRALYNPQCTPLELPADKYDQWKHIDFTFDPRDML